jgi:hypothetical protein
MRKTLIALASATALALSSAASAAVTVTSSTNLNDPNPTAAGSVVTNGGITTINFGQNPVANPSFTGSFTFNNDVANLYTIVLSTSTPGVTFTSAVISGGSCTPATCTLSPFPDNTSLKLANALLTVGTYTFSFGGNNTNTSGALTGNVTISAVPEATTWAMMILGFGAVGMAMRGRRRRTVLAQVA